MQIQVLQLKTFLLSRDRNEFIYIHLKNGKSFVRYTFVVLVVEIYSCLRA